MKTINNQQPACRQARSTINNFSFTLIEILVVTTIIGVLSGVATISYSSLTRSSRDARRRADLEQIRAALEMYRSNDLVGAYPDAADCGTLAPLIATQLPNFPTDPKTGFTYSCTSSSATYTLYSALETGEYTTCVGGNCGGSDCEYALGPYGKTCGP